MAIRFESSKKLKAFYKKLVDYKQKHQTDSVEMSILNAINRLIATEKTLKKMELVGQSEYMDAYYALLSNSRKKLAALLDVRPLTIAVLGSSKKTRVLENLLNLQTIPINGDETSYAFGVPNTVEVMVNNHLELLDIEALIPYLESTLSDNEQNKSDLADQLSTLQALNADDKNALVDIQKEYEHELTLLNYNLNHIKYLSENDLLKTYTFVTIDHDAFDDMDVNYDGIIYLIDQDQLNYQLPETLLTLLNKSRSLGIYVDTVDYDSDSTIQEIQNRFNKSFDSVKVLGDNIDVLKTSLSDVFKKDEKVLLMETKISRFLHTIDTYKKNARKMNFELMTKYNGLSTYKSQLKTIIDKEYDGIKSKTQWSLNSYEMRTKISIESNVKELQKYATDVSGLKQFIDQNIFALSDFEKEIQQLVQNLDKLKHKLLGSHIEGYFIKNKYFNPEDDMTTQNTIQNIEMPKIIQVEQQWLEDTLMPLLKSSNSIFSFMKKSQSIQPVLLKQLESSVELTKKNIMEIIETQWTNMNQILLSDMEVEFNKKYLPYNSVNHMIRLIEDRLKLIDSTPTNLALKDMMISSKELFYD